ncbi:hypothetical protein MIZ03_2067 [Rhodoferax lithotrophicus]|uniref:Uncharacterized protein n=1 Tax=Rhodoferax lithotrophicus TaxID=2798804 RepID=A0ABM7MLL6_9BURK|nr:hypothetical protein MIZ03_2067 [Rhodoferax sp. MIZ03]
MNSTQRHLSQVPFLHFWGARIKLTPSNKVCSTLFSIQLNESTNVL